MLKAQISILKHLPKTIGKTVLLKKLLIIKQMKIIRAKTKNTKSQNLKGGGKDRKIKAQCTIALMGQFISQMNGMKMMMFFVDSFTKSETINVTEFLT